MSLRKSLRDRRPADLMVAAAKVLQPPCVIALGSPLEALEMVQALPSGTTTCWQMDLHQAGRLRDALAEAGAAGNVAAAPDLWDLEVRPHTVLYPAAATGERLLKIDVVEQAYHLLAPGGCLVVLSPGKTDRFFPDLLKKTFGNTHAPMEGRNAVVWSRRGADRPRRVHETHFHVRAGENTSLDLVSRPGVFGHGKMDEGARALVEAAAIEPGARILDMGCGHGAVGILAGLRAGPKGFVLFADSNLRAVALAERNAVAVGLPNFRVVASCTLDHLDRNGFDVVLANPPYFGQMSICRLFAEQGRRHLRPNGRFYLVTKQVEQAGTILEETFRSVEIEFRRGYGVFAAEI